MLSSTITNCTRNRVNSNDDLERELISEMDGSKKKKQIGGSLLQFNQEDKYNSKSARVYDEKRLQDILNAFKSNNL